MGPFRQSGGEEGGLMLEEERGKVQRGFHPERRGRNGCGNLYASPRPQSPGGRGRFWGEAASDNVRRERQKTLTLRWQVLHLLSRLENFSRRDSWKGLAGGGGGGGPCRDICVL